MPSYFADAATQDTRGDRGRTTRRKGTRTVRGCEGAYIAACKDEAGPMHWYKVISVTVRWRNGVWVEREYPDGRWADRADAEQYMAETTAPDRLTAPQTDGRSYTVRKYIKTTTRRTP